MVIVSNFRLGIGGDLITAGDGQPIEDKESLKRLMDKKHGGDMLELTVYRNGRNEKDPDETGRSAAAVLGKVRKG